MSDQKEKDKAPEGGAPKGPPEVNQKPPEPVVEAAPEEPKKVMFQVDKDTAVEAEVVKERENDRIDLIAVVDRQAYKTNLGGGPQALLHENVRPGSKFEPGTYYPIPTE